MILGLVAAAGFNCNVEFVNDKGEVTDVNGKLKLSIVVQGAGTGDCRIRLKIASCITILESRDRISLKI